MKKILLSVIVMACAAFSFQLHAQCTPNPTQVDFLLPDTSTNLDPAFTFMAYDEVLYISVPTDTNIFSMPASIDSIRFVSIDGLPASISYVPNPISGVFLGGTKGCIAFSGTPTAGEIGTYPLTINAEVTGFLGILGDTTIAAPLEGYTLRVLDSASYGIYHYEAKYSFFVYQNAPNPFRDLTDIAFTSPGKEVVNLQIFDILGHLVYQEQMISKAGYNSFRFEGNKLKPGIYIYKVSNGEIVYSHRMSLSSK